jgi:hypothetical protein
MRMILGAASRMQDAARDAVFAQVAKKSKSPSAAAATQSLPDVKAAWLQSVEEMPAPKIVSENSADAVFSTLDGRQDLLKLFRW